MAPAAPYVNWPGDRHCLRSPGNQVDTGLGRLTWTATHDHRTVEPVVIVEVVTDGLEKHGRFACGQGAAHPV